MFNFCQKIRPGSLLPLYTLWVSILINNYRDLDHHLKVPQLSTHLYWSHNPVTSLFSVNFEAIPPSLTGTTTTNSTWVAWGINPTGSALIGTKLILLSLDSHREVVTKMYNVTSEAAMDETNTFWGNFVTFKSSFDSGLMKFEAEILLPENRETINQVFMIGAGKPNVLGTNLKSFGVLNLKQTKQSIFSKVVDAYSRALIFEKECTLGRKKASWDEYLISKNENIAFKYLVLTFAITYIEMRRENSRRAELVRLLCMLMALMSMAIMELLVSIKENGELCFNFLSFVRCCFSINS